MLNFKNIALCVQFPRNWEYKPFIKLFLLFIIYILLPFGEAGRGFAQNLVFNGDFEIFDTCPNQTSSLIIRELEYATGWVMPTDGTSDYFNACNTNPNPYANVDVPNNFVGYQNAYNGVGYAGLYAYVNYLNATEYIQGTLNEPLKAGHSYSVSFYISHADSSEYSITEIGAYFSENAITHVGFEPFNVIPQIQSPIGLFLNDMNSWLKIEGTFVANGGEKYITIGNFKDSVDMDTLNTGISSSTGQDGAYYYVDGINLEEMEVIDSNIITPMLIPNIITPNGDGFNDLFRLNFKYESAIIFNRWGQQLFKSNSNESFWDGRITSGNEVPDGTYYYIITTENEIYKGFIQLLR